MNKKFMTGLDLLNHLNRTYLKLHKAYERAFWTSYMGDHSVDKRMTIAQKERDNFRSNRELKTEVEKQILKSKGETKRRLEIWNNFFGLFQIPLSAVSIKNEAIELESEVMKKRTTRKEGYIDPVTKKFIVASENKMRVLMRTNQNEKVRKACFESLEKLAGECVSDYVKQVKQRNKFAKVIGYKDFYDYKIHIDEGMSKKELFAIFEDVYNKTKYAFKNVRKLEKVYPNLRKPWNFSFMLTGDFVKEEDQYFQFENALSYWGKSYNALGVDFQQVSINLDLIDRKGKYNNGFCHWPVPIHYEGGRRIPGVCDFTSNAIVNQVGSGINGIHTLFHEAGHAAHLLNSTQEDCCINTEYPPSTVSWAETQSMFMDSISASIEWKMRYAKNANGKSYPFELYEKKARKIYPLIPLDLMGIMFVVFFEKEIYECKNLTAEIAIKIAKRIYKKYFDRSVDSISIFNVPHIYNWESAAYYHGYGLAELGVEQWREYFLKKYGYIVDNPNVGREMREVWKYSALYASNKFIKMATGKSLGPNAYVKSVTKPLNGILSDAKKRVVRLQKVPHINKAVKLNARISMYHGKKKIADNSKGFGSMDRTYRAWLKTVK